jgi:hypothetical protein
MSIPITGCVRATGKAASSVIARCSLWVTWNQFFHLKRFPFSVNASTRFTSRAKHSSSHRFVMTRWKPLCTKYVGLLHEAQKIEKAKKKAAGIEQVYIDRTTNSDIREVGGEWLCLQACRQLLLPEYLETFGWEKQDIALALTQIIARAVYPASEYKTSRWVEGELGAL